MAFPPCPPSLKGIQHYLKLAQEHEGRDIIVAYWSRIYALEMALKMTKQQPGEELLVALLDWLDAVKRDHSQNECITNEVAAQAHLENYALKLFLYADKQDREANFGKNVVKAFYSCGVVYDVIQTFGELSDEAAQNRKYAKWKAAYIHNCLKNGETPVPGPMPEEDFAGEGGNGNGNGNNGDAAGGDNLSPPTTPNDNANGTAEPMFPNPSPPSVTPPTADEVLQNPDKLPSPPVDEEKPGGFVPFVPPAQPHLVYTPPVPVAGLQVTPEQMIKAQKYCKYAGSALNYDDVKTAIDNLQKALTLLTTGQDS